MLHFILEDGLLYSIQEQVAAAITPELDVLKGILLVRGLSDADIQGGAPYASGTPMQVNAKADTESPDVFIAKSPFKDLLLSILKQAIKVSLPADSIRLKAVPEGDKMIYGFDRWVADNRYKNVKGPLIEQKKAQLDRALGTFAQQMTAFHGGASLLPPSKETLDAIGYKETVIPVDEALLTKLANMLMTKIIEAMTTTHKKELEKILGYSTSKRLYIPTVQAIKTKCADLFPLANGQFAGAKGDDVAMAGEYPLYVDYMMGLILLQQKNQQEVNAASAVAPAAPAPADAPGPAGAPAGPADAGGAAAS